METILYFYDIDVFKSVVKWSVMIYMLIFIFTAISNIITLMFFKLSFYFKDVIIYSLVIWILINIINIFLLFSFSILNYIFKTF